MLVFLFMLKALVFILLSVRGGWGVKHMAVRGQLVGVSSLLPRQDCRRAPLPTKPSHWPLILFKDLLCF